MYPSNHLEFPLYEYWFRQRTNFEIIRDLKLKAEYYRYLSIKYDEEYNRQISTGDIRDIHKLHDVDKEKIELPFVKCEDQKHQYVKDKILYRCVNCGQENTLEQCNISLPIDIIVKILRSDKSLFHLSRTTSKTIRNKSLTDILQYEMLKPIINNEYGFLREPTVFIQDESFYDCDQGGHYGKSNTYLILETYDKFGEFRTYPKYYYKSEWSRGHDEKNSTSTSDFGELDNHNLITGTQGYDQITYVDFISYYNVIVERLKYYECDKQTLALKLTLNKFDSYKDSSTIFMFMLIGTSIILGINIPSPINQFKTKELINLFKIPVRNHILNLK